MPVKSNNGEEIRLPTGKPEIRMKEWSVWAAQADVQNGVASR